jgi:hypothetical protein
MTNLTTGKAARPPPHGGCQTPHQRLRVDTWWRQRSESNTAGLGYLADHANAPLYQMCEIEIDAASDPTPAIDKKLSRP